MKYKNPVIRGFYPDPSVCAANGKYYLVTSTMHFFPGVPVFESTDLVNWKQIGHCLTKDSQLDLYKEVSSGGIFAPSIRFNNGRFYMVTTNTKSRKNYYVWTDDIYSDNWSEPVYVDQDGIDPSMLFADGTCYFTTTGLDDNGEDGITQCEIDIETGEKKTKSIKIWGGSGGRYTEGPHLYKMNDYYYLMIAEGGTEYGHMETLARSKNPFGPFESYTENPILTNRNLGRNIIQGVGHADLVEGPDGNFYLIHLGFRQTGEYMPFHHLGRETFLTPVEFTEDGWFRATEGKITKDEYDIPIEGEQIIKNVETFENTDFDLDWVYLRNPHRENYELSKDKVKLKGSYVTLEEQDSPTFIGIRQKDFDSKISVKVNVKSGEAGLSIMMCERNHYDLCVSKVDGMCVAMLKLNIGDIKHVQKLTMIEPDKNGNVELIIKSDSLNYTFSVKGSSKEEMGKAETRYVSSEVATGFTGVVVGLYSITESAEFTNFKVAYN